MLDWQLCQICYPLEIKLLLLYHSAQLTYFAELDELSKLTEWHEPVNMLKGKEGGLTHRLAYNA